MSQDFLASTFEGFGISIPSAAASWFGLGGILRISEGIDSIANFVRASTLSGRDAVGAAFCGVVELGGVVYSVVILLGLLLLLPVIALAQCVFGVFFDLSILACSSATAANQSRLRRKRLQAAEKKKKREEVREAKAEKKKELAEAIGSLKEAEQKPVQKEQTKKQKAAEQKKTDLRSALTTLKKNERAPKTRASVGFLSGLAGRVSYSQVRTGPEDVV